MKKLIPSVLAVLIIMGMAGCRRVRTSMTKKDLYTKTNIRYNQSRKIAYFINYRNLKPLPINSKVQIFKVNKEGFQMKLPSGKRIKFIYKEQWGGKAIDAILPSLFSETDISDEISKLSEIDRKGIKKAKAFKGMSKQGVIMALGIPPAHKTESVEENIWVYWKHRHSYYILVFKNGKVIKVDAKIRDLMNSKSLRDFGSLSSA